MKVGIIGDVHLGSSFNLGVPHPELHINTRLLDVYNTLIHTIEDMIVAGVKIIIFTGDIFEHRTPALVQQKMFSQALHHAIKNGIKHIHIVVGNHDQQRIHTTTTLSYLKELKLNNISIHDDLCSVPLLNGTKQIVNLLFMPYRDRKWYDTEVYTEAINKMDTELKYLLAGIDNDLPKILVGHMAIEGTLLTDDYLDLYGENQLFLPISMFNGIHITIMGHIHEPNIISKEPYLAYVGSMEKRGGFEKDKYYIILDTDDLSLEFIKEPCRNIFDIKLDYSHLSINDLLLDRIKSDIVDFSSDKDMVESIVKINIKLSASDEEFFVGKAIQGFVKETLNVYNCLDIKPEVFSPRQARDERINEQISDAEAFKLYISSLNEDAKFKQEIIAAGLDIIKQLETTDGAGKH